MSQRTLGLITIFLGTLFVIALGFAILFGVKLNSAAQQKTKEISNSIEAREKELKAIFQSEKEETVINYIADEVFGAFEFSYPKVWSTNVEQEVGAAKELVFMADPNMIVINKEVPGPYPALRVVVFQEKYANKLKDTENSNKNVKSPMTEEDATVSELSGKRFTGVEVKSGKQFSYVILPLRDKTLYIGTDDLSVYSDNYETILKTFKISK